MELWLLAAGVVLLVAITAWLVWPTRPEENISMRSNPETPDPQDLPPQGDRFEDQYTSATGDLSAGGVAEAFAHPEPTGPELTQPGPPSAPSPSSPDAWRPPVGREGTGDIYQTPIPSSHSYPGAPVPPEHSVPMLPLTAAAVVGVGGAVAGAWLYTRWQERNKPVNRLRRRAHHVADSIGDRLPDVDDLPSGKAPRSGAAAALLLATVALARALRSHSDDDEDEEERRAEQQRQLSYLDRGRWRDRLGSVDWASLLREPPDTDEARKRARRLLRDLPDADDARKHGKRLARQLPSVEDAQDEDKRGLFGLGLGGVAALAAGTYLVWRVVRG
ncbi:MAG: hypothetical protein JOZ81_11010 [Chloroflexi bacterium]|nr:hypothetical protein [Chloroflexota bacterium]